MNYRRELDAIFEQVPMRELTDFMGALEAVKLEALTKTIAEAQRAANGSDPKAQADYTTADIARMYDRSRQTVRGWIKKDLLDAYKFMGGPEWRITPANAEKFKREQRERLRLKVVSPRPDISAWQKVAVG